MHFAELVHAWHDFYLLLGTAAATLVGLMFVAASIGANVFREDNRAAMQAFLSSTVVHFVAVLMVCVVLEVPTHSWPGLAALLTLAGIAGGAYSARNLMHILIRRSFKVDMIDRLFYALIPIVGYLLILAAAALMFAQPQWGMDTLAAALIVLMLAGLRNAWDMMTWIVIKTPGERGSGR